MNAHPDPDTLRAYASGRLAPTRTMAIDTHARECATCRDALRATAPPAALRRALLRIEREGGHLAYEELSALVDGKLAAARRPVVERHLAICARCRRERVDLQQAAAVLAQPLRARAAASDGFFASLGRWIGSPGGMRAATAGIVAAAAAAFVLSNQLGTGGDTTGATTSARYGDDRDETAPTAASPVDVAPVDHAVFERLDRIAPEVVSAYRAGDLATVAKALEARARRGEAGAAHALGLLYAEGRGVPIDRAKATTLLKQAAAKNDDGAAADLARLQAQPASNGSH